MTDLVLVPHTASDVDTLPLSASLDVTPAPVASWQIATLTTLSEVEDLLDCLEAHDVGEREVIALDNNRFAVRWR
jgi:hypothetical protein